MKYAYILYFVFAVFIIGFGSALLINGMPNTPDTPDTGDRDPVSKVILLMCFAVVSVAGIVFYRKKFTGESK